MIHLECENEKLRKAIEWLLREVESIPFGEVGINITIHERQVRFISRSVTEKDKAKNG